MPINFTFSLTPSGSALKNPIDFGEQSNTSTSLKEIPVYVKHDSPSDLQGVGFYLQPYAGDGYKGTYGETADYLKWLTWGQTVGEGLILNPDAQNTAIGSDVQFKGGGSPVGDSMKNPIMAQPSMFVGGQGTAQGHFPAGVEAHFTLKLGIPATETAAGEVFAHIFTKLES